MTELKGQAAYLAKKELKERQQQEARNIQKRTQSFRRLKNFILTAVVFAVLGGGFFLLTQSQAPQGQDFSQGYPLQGREHIQAGSLHPPYNSNPPSSGWHYPSPARIDFYQLPLEDEQLVHNLEHGDIWIAYHSRISEKLKDSLKRLAGGRVIITPREANEADIALVAWGRVDSFNVENDILDEQRIRDFIKRYQNQGPERSGP